MYIYSMAPTAYVFRISLDCPHCRTGVAVNGFTHEVLCGNCLKSVALPQEWWEGFLDNETIEEALSQEAGHATTTSHLGGMSEKIDAGNRPPRCQECKTEFTTEQMQAGARAGFFNCKGCNKRIRARAATPLVLSLIREADLVINEDETGENLESDGGHPAQPVMFGCLSCGGGLKVDGSSRLVKCSHCANDNYLPDSLWLRLHPVVTSHVFFVTRKAEREIKSPILEEAPKNLTEDRALKLLKDQKLKPVVLHGVFEQLEDEDDVLIALAKHPQADEELLLKLCDGSHYYQVRVAVAKRAELPIRIISELAFDDDTDVKKALLKRSGIFSVPKGVLEGILHGTNLSDLGESLMHKDFPEWKLYELSDYCTPESAARIIRSPNTSLRVLRRLGSNPTSREILKAHPLYQQLGWFRKLFFFAGE